MSTQTERKVSPMTRDPLEWLRSLEKNFNITAQPETAAKYKGAADEIERLRAQNAMLADAATMIVERVKAALRESTAEVIQMSRKG